MDWALVIITSFNMAIDASVTSAADSVRVGRKGFGKIVLACFLFGVFQGLMPLIGYLIGSSFKKYIETWIPFIAFALLLILAIKGFVDFGKEMSGKGEEEEEGKLSYKEIVFQAVATSIDALCIGFTFLSYSLPNALIAFACIAGITFLLSLVCGSLGQFLSGVLKRYSGLVSGLVFLGIGLKILLDALL